MTISAICTAITPAFLAHARSLAADLARFAPQAPFYVLCIEDPAERSVLADDEPFHVLRLEDLGDADAVRHMCFYYTAFELSCAVRGLLHRYLRDCTDHQHWLFLDSDMMVVSPMGDVLATIEQAPITLTPHCRTPVYPTHRETPELELLLGGPFNAGFVGIHRDDHSSRFIEWLCERLERYGFFQPPMQCDQAWIGLTPLFFPQFQAMDHPGVNLGHWNLHERKLTRSVDGEARSNDRPIVLVHFSGFDPTNPARVSRWAPQFDGKAPQVWRELAGQYAEQLLRCGWEDCKDIPPPFQRLRNGTKIEPAMRQAHYQAVLAGEATQRDPFEAAPKISREVVRPPLRRGRLAAAAQRLRRGWWSHEPEVDGA